MDFLNCNFDTARFLIFSDNVFNPMIYYSHLFPMSVSLLMGFLVFFRNTKKNQNRIFFIFSLLFSLWVLFDLVLWSSEKPELVMFFWSSIVLIEYMIFATGFFLLKGFSFEKGTFVSIQNLIILFFIPIVFLIHTTYNLTAFDYSNCDRGAFEGILIKYLYLSEFVILAFSFFVFYKSIFSNNAKNIRKENILFGSGILSFMIIFIAGNITLISDLGWGYEQYKLFGMVLFMAILAYMIVKFKTFNIKLLATQALIWVIIILIGSQFFFIRTTINMILTAITFLFVSIAGLILVRSVKKVDEQRELLDVANKNQQSLLHFITHQVKGFMTKSRGIFAGMLEGDYGDINGKVRQMAEYGLKSETKGVETIQNILHASDLKSGTVEFVKKEFDLTSLAKKVIEDSKPKALEKGLEIVENISSKPIIFNGDELRMKEVFKNLIDNSILYTVHGTISITLKIKNEGISFSVKDTGVGLSLDDKKDLFNEGGRGKDSLIHNVDSTGYGLFITKKIIKEHGGHIWAESEGRDKGSEFIVELPIR